MQYFVKYVLYTAFLFNYGETQLLFDGLIQAVNEFANPVNTTQFVPTENITYYLYNSSSPDTYDNIHFCNASALNTSNKIVVVIHGWGEDRKADWLQLVRKAFFARDSRYLVVEVDWSSYSKLDYADSYSVTNRIGYTIADFITYVIKLHSVPLENFLIVGYSMGAHIAGFMGKQIYQLLGKRFKRIVGLDPAGPQYAYKSTADRLASTDAYVVQVIYTNNGHLGDNGSMNIRPNGGHDQPGCAEETRDQEDRVAAFNLCSSRRSILYFAEGIQASPKFVAAECYSYRDYVADRQVFCRQKTEEMCSLTTTNAGNFFLNTNSKSPYSKE